MHYFTTDAFTHHARVNSWRDQVNYLYPTTELITETRPEFWGRIAWRDVGVTRVSRIESVAQRVVRTERQARADHERLLQINLQVEGEGYLEQAGRTVVTRPGQFVLYDSARPYEMRFSGSFRGLSLELPHSAVERYICDLDSLVARPIEGSCGPGRFLFEFVRVLAADEDPADHAQALRLQRHAHELLITAIVSFNGAQSGSSRSRRCSLEQIKRYARDRLDNPDLTPAAIAAAQNISLRYLHAIFHAAGSTPAGWIQAERLESCRAELMDPSQAHRSICEIAHRWCFRDAAHFSRAFRRRFGYAPSACRAASPPK